MLRTDLLRMTLHDVPWQALTADLRRYVARRVPVAEVDDLVQDVITRAFAARDTLRDDLPLQPWLFTIARNAITDHLRARKPSATDEAVPPSDDTPEADAIATESEMLRTLVGRWLEASVATLPEPQREAVHRVDVLGQRQADVAESLGIPYSTLKSRVQRGRLEVRERFLNCCHVELDHRGTLTGIAPRDTPGGDCC
ncbi:MAG: sigma-70 family RNA polymerase sigma factor [Myxococcota bacterium]